MKPAQLDPAFCASSIHLRMSALTKSRNCAGVLGCGSAPCSASRFFRSSDSSTLRMSALMRSTTAAGVSFGANMPNQPSES